MGRSQNLGSAHQKWRGKRAGPAGWACFATPSLIFSTKRLTNIVCFSPRQIYPLHDIQLRNNREILEMWILNGSRSLYEFLKFNFMLLYTIINVNFFFVWNRREPKPKRKDYT
jgi:hypothetical protein